MFFLPFYNHDTCYVCMFFYVILIFSDKNKKFAKNFFSDFERIVQFIK